MLTNPAGMTRLAGGDLIVGAGALYGDLHPTTDLSKIFTAALLVAGGGVFVRFITKVAALRTARHHRRRNGDDRP